MIEFRVHGEGSQRPVVLCSLSDVNDYVNVAGVQLFRFRAPVIYCHSAGVHTHLHINAAYLLANSHRKPSFWHTRLSVLASLLFQPSPVTASFTLVRVST